MITFRQPNYYSNTNFKVSSFFFFLKKKKRIGRLYDGGSKYEQQETCCETICPLPTSIKRYIRQPPLSFLYQSSSFQISITQRVESMGIRSRDELLTCWTAFFCLHICHAQHFGLYPQDMSCAHLLPSGWIQVSV